MKELVEVWKVWNGMVVTVINIKGHSHDEPFRSPTTSHKRPGRRSRSRPSNSLYV